MKHKHITLTHAKSIFASVVAGFLTFTQPIYAQVAPIENKAVPANLTDYNLATSGAAFAYYFIFIWRTLILIGGLLVIVYFIQAAFEWIGAGGEAGKIATARNKMTGAVAGFVILVGVLVITQFIEGAFGLNILNPNIPTASDPRFTTP